MENATFKILEKEEYSIWWDVAAQCSHTTFFHTPVWHEIAINAYEEFENGTVFVQLDNGTRVIVPMLSSKRAVIFQRLLSTFGNCYGGYIADDPITPEQVRAIYNKICNWKATSYYFLESPLADSIDLSDTMSALDDFTQIVELEDFDDVFASFSKGHRSSYRKGVRLGVQVEEAATLEEYKAYFHMYHDSIRRWAEKHGETPTAYTWDLFEAIYNAGQAYPDNVKLYLAKLDGKMISGQLNFYFNDYIVAWHGATYEEYFSYCPVNVLDTELIRDGIEKGYKYYDFNPSGGFDGVARYKSRFGAKTYPVKRWLYENSYWRSAKNLASKLRA